MPDMRMVVGGGGRPTIESIGFIEAGLHLTGQQRPKILLIATAKYTPAAFASAVAEFEEFGHHRGLEIKLLHRFGEAPTPEITRELIDWADAVYCFGGDTDHAMKILRNAGVIDIVAQAIMLGLVTWIGISAGAILPFGLGHSDTDSYPYDRRALEDRTLKALRGTKGISAEAAIWDAEFMPTTPAPNWHYRLIEGAGAVERTLEWSPTQIAICPHFDQNHPLTDEPRDEHFTTLLLQRETEQPALRVSSRPLVGIGLANSAALVIIGQGQGLKCHVVSAKAHGYVTTLRAVDNRRITRLRLHARDHELFFTDLFPV